MAAKVRRERGAWWIHVHFAGRRKKKRVGPTKADKREAEMIENGEEPSHALVLEFLHTMTHHFKGCSKVFAAAKGMTGEVDEAAALHRGDMRMMLSEGSAP